MKNLFLVAGTAFLVVFATNVAQAQFTVENNTDCSYDIGIQYGTTACGNNGTIFGTVHPGSTDFYPPASDVGYTFRIYDGKVDPTVGSGCSGLAPDVTVPDYCSDGVTVHDVHISFDANLAPQGYVEIYY